MGYVGAALVKYLREEYPSSNLIGFDIGFFGSYLTTKKRSPDTYLDRQEFGDLREFPNEILNGVDAVVCLSAISNDPMGNQFEFVTSDINRISTVNLVKQAALAGVKNFIFASSCSIYGQSDGNAKKETDETNPLTAYAKSKILVESDVFSLNLGGMVFTSLRFSTACGMSDRLRLDLVLNDFVASALTKKEISILSDGTPWRPLIDVIDMALAIDWGIHRTAANGGDKLVVNVGANSNNFQVKDLAFKVAQILPDVSVSINHNAQPDKRSYKVDFSLYEKLAPMHLPKVTLEESIKRLVIGLNDIGFSDADFRNSDLYIRLNSLRNLMKLGKLDENLKWN